MGLSIVLTDYSGHIFDRVDDTKNLLHKLLPLSDETSKSLLPKIDWYGDTYFNYLQMKHFLEEWDELRHRAETEEELSLIEAVRGLALRSQSDRTVLRFIGD